MGAQKRLAPAPALRVSERPYEDCTIGRARTPKPRDVPSEDELTRMGIRSHPAGSANNQELQTMNAEMKNGATSHQSRKLACSRPRSPPHLLLQSVQDRSLVDETHLSTPPRRKFAKVATEFSRLRSPLEIAAKERKAAATQLVTHLERDPRSLALATLPFPAQ